MSEPNIRLLHTVRLAAAMRAFGLTARAIRFYEQRGLITTGRDRKNARILEAIACRRLAWIAKLRGAGISLADIAEILDAEESESGRRRQALGKLDARRLAVEAELRQIEETVASLDRLEPLTGPQRPLHGRPWDQTVGRAAIS